MSSIIFTDKLSHMRPVNTEYTQNAVDSGHFICYFSINNSVGTSDLSLEKMSGNWERPWHNPCLKRD